MYSHEIESVDSVLDHIKFPPVTAANGLPVTPAQEAAFRRALYQYLRGVGHVDHVWTRTQLTPEDFERHKDDKLIRVKNLMKLMTGADLDPVDTSYKIEVRLSISCCHYICLLQP